MHPYLAELQRTAIVLDAEGQPRPLDSHISCEEGLFLQEVIRDIRPATSLEIGMAFGVSTMFICEALREVGAGKHIAIDPGPVYHEGSRALDRCGLGLLNLERCGYREMVDFQEGPSELVLPKLLERGQRIDFAFVDGWHTFDHCLLDFFYVNRLLNPGGAVVFHDIRMPSIRRVLRYVQNYPAYRPCGVAIPSRPAFQTRRQGIQRAIAFALHLGRALVPRRPTAAALKKIEPDDRTWTWYRRF
ncbi:MAG TPA: class I SAM-dependent methyltransferase [Candidatus Sulfotelmatobacter sp.]|nr:class I SAM-dependent methyltransferase [Candidatus Sulfotelmatobacter sp.]